MRMNKHYFFKRNFNCKSKLNNKAQVTWWTTKNTKNSK